MEKNVSLEVLNSGDISSLSEIRQREILELKNGLELTHQGIMNFGVEASNNLNDFSTTILQEVKVKDVPEIGTLVQDLMDNINSIDPESLLKSKPSFFKRMFHVEDVQGFIKKYDNVEAVILDIKSKMQSAQMQIEKDIVMLDTFIEQNLKYINDLDSYILAGTLKKKDAELEIEKLKNEINPEDTLAVQELNRYQNALERLDKKIYNLKLLRETAVQNIPQIVLIQQGDCVAVDNIQSSIDSAIPLWESQIVIAITLARQKNVVDLQSNVVKTINEMIRNNSELVKSNALSIARQMESGMIDVDVLKKSSQNLIETLDGIKKIRIEGEKQRDEALRVLTDNQAKLTQAIIAQRDNNSSKEKISELDSIREKITLEF